MFIRFILFAFLYTYKKIFNYHLITKIKNRDKERERDKQ